MSLYYWLTASLALASASAAAELQQAGTEVGTWAAIDKTTITEEVAIRPDNGNRMTVPVSVGGRGPYRFVVDSGAERTVISRELAQQLRLSSGNSTVLHSIIGANGVDTVHIPNLKVSSKVVSVSNAPALDASDIGADGLLGIDSLKSQRVLFNFKAGTMSISPSSAPVGRLEGQTIVVRARSRNGRLIFAEARIKGRKVKVIVDTGSQVTIGNLALQRSLSKRGVETLPDSIAIESVTGEKMNAPVAWLPELDIGGIKLRDLSVAFADAHIFRQLKLDDQPALLLGMNAMRAFDQISIDFAAKKVRFVLPSTSMRNDARLASAS